MSKSVRLASILLILVFGITACNLPSNATPTHGADAVLTAAAQTVEANLTQVAILNPPTIPPTSTAGISTSTLAVSENTSVPPTSVPSATQACDVAQFVDDVTIPDGTVLTPNQAFTKTWRLKNVGSCSWTPSYAIVFNSGDSMNGPATQALAGNVNPGDTVDISVNLTAPAADGGYRGYWKLRNASGVLFTQFYVDIKVQTPAPSSTTVTLNSTIGGTVYKPALNIPNSILAGDTSSDEEARGFMSFDISAMSGKTIDSAALDLTGCTVVHDPFGNLSGIWVGEVQFGPTLDQSDFDLSGTGIQLLNAVPASTIDVKSYVQARASANEPRFQIRLHPALSGGNHDSQADYMACSAPKLKVTYQP